MQNMHRCFLVFCFVLGVARAAELVKPNPTNCELVVNDLTQLQSTTQNSMGFKVEVSNGMQQAIATDGDPRLILTPNTTSSFWYSFVRKPGQCFNASNFEYISLDVKATADVQMLVGFSSNPVHCDETAESVVEYSMVLMGNKKGTGERETVDIPISSLPGSAKKDNMYAILIGGATSPIELYSVKLKGSCASGITEDTIVSSFDTNDSESDKDDSKECSLAIEDFSDANENENALRGTHGSDSSMLNETYSADEGLQLTSKDSSSFWFTVIPCMKFKHYDMLALTVQGPSGGDFQIQVVAKEECEKAFKEFTLRASEFLGGRLTGATQQVLIPFDRLSGFDKSKHTISSIVVGDFVNAGETHDSASPMNLNIKNISLRGQNCDETDDEDENEVHIQAKNYPREQDNEDGLDHSHKSSSSKSVISILAILVVALFMTV